MSLDTAGISKSIQYGFPSAFVSYEINSLPLSWSVSSSMRRSLLYFIFRDWQETDLSSICDSFMKVALMSRKYNIQCLFPKIVSNLSVVLWKWSRTSRSTPCFPCCGFFLPSRWTGWIFGSRPSLPSATRGRCVCVCVSNWWVSFLTVSLRMSSCFWTVECGRPCILKSILPLRVCPNSSVPL